MGNFSSHIEKKYSKIFLGNAEKRSTEGLSKPTTLDEANAMFANVQDFDNACLKHLKILEGMREKDFLIRNDYLKKRINSR